MTTIATDSIASIQPPRARAMREIRQLLDSQSVLTGDPLPSERVLALKLGVSRETVRSALRGLQAAGVIHGGAARTRRTVARRPASTESGGLMAGAVAMITQSPESGKVVPVAKGMDLYIQTELTRLLHESGIHVLLLSPDAARGEGLQRLIGSRPGALVATYGVADCEPGRAILREVAAAGIPVIVNGSNSALATFDRVVSDHSNGSAQLVKWLVSQGRRRILRFWRFARQSDWLLQRNAGYEAATAEAGIEALPTLHTPDLLSGEETNDDFNHVRRLLAGYLLEAFANDPAIDAIMAATDLHAYQINAALRLIGKKPGQDVLVVGYDNTYADIPAREWEPVGPAATIDKDNKKIAEELASLLTGRVSRQLTAGAQCRASEPRLVVPASPPVMS